LRWESREVGQSWEWKWELEIGNGNGNQTARNGNDVMKGWMNRALVGALPKEP